MIKNYLATLLLATISLFAEAQVNVDVLMDTLDIPATSIPATIATTGRNVSVVTGEQIQQLPATTIDDVLRYLPGIEVQARNGFGAQADISMRGSTFTQVLVLIDGMRLNDPLTAHFNANIPVAISEIERIEVLRGPAAAMYGPDAVGGVVHIITKTFANNANNNGNGFSADLSVDFGEENLLRSNGGIFYDNGKAKVGLSFLFNRSDGQTVDAQSFITDSGDTTNLEGYDNYFDVRTITLSGAVRLSDNWNAAARVAYDYRDFSARYFYTSSALDKSTEITSNLWAQTQFQHIGSNSATDINLAFKNNLDTFIYSPDFPSTNHHQTQFYNFQVNHLHRINENFDVKVGLQADYRSIESNDRGNHSDVHAGLYAIAISRPTEGLQVAASLRGDYDQNYDFELSPQLNATYNASPTLKLRAAVGRSIRAADYTERYISFNLENLGAGRNLGNPDLLAERSWSEEIGMDWSPIKEWRFTATGFLRQGNNLIDYVITNENDIIYNENLRDSADYFLATNIANVQTAGFELESWYSRKLGNANLFWGVGYTYLNTTNENDVISTYLSNHARHLFNTQLIMQYGIMDIAINGLYKARTGRTAAAINTNLSESYSVWNARVSVQILPNLGINFMVQNIFDEQYADILGAKMPSRWLMAGARWRF